LNQKAMYLPNHQTETLARIGASLENDAQHY